jgi:hypothetical protein
MISGNLILSVYYLIIFSVFVVEIISKRKNISDTKETKRGPVSNILYKTVRFYEAHGLISIILFFLLISFIILFTSGENRIYIYIIDIITHGLLFVLMFIVKGIFIGIDQFKNIIISRFVDEIFYIVFVVGYILVFPDITKPSIALVLIGLFFAFVLTCYVMIIAIFNPQALLRDRRKNKLVQKEKSEKLIKNNLIRNYTNILTGIIMIILLQMIILWVMIYAVYHENSDFYLYMVTGNNLLTNFDLLYYLIISVSTIGYGEIVPVSVPGLLPYSQIIAMLIAFVNIFSFTCFLATIISNVSSYSKEIKEIKEEQKE